MCILKVYVHSQGQFLLPQETQPHRLFLPGALLSLCFTWTPTWHQPLALDFHKSHQQSICVQVTVGPSDVSGLFNLQLNLHIQREVGVPSLAHPQRISVRQLRFTFLSTEMQASQGWGVGLFCSLLIFPASGSFPVSQLFV